ncbi:MAG: transcription elongation factor regulatory protein [Xanthobacteraceae bacterium]|nr:MAG: transcription elongation factor regulatory protein [Xanthobacteraceae bacterium]
MSVAFTKENDRDGTEANLQDRPISQHPNLVTPRGLALLEAALEAARAAVQQARAAGEDATGLALARASRDFRYFSARHANAQLMEPPPADGKVHFGSRVTFDRDDGRRQTFQIVGEDEAEPSQGTISYVSPVARALMGKQVSDVAVVGGGEVEIVSIG